MHLKIYTIYDIVAEDSAPLFCAKNDLTAVRSAMISLQQVTDPADYQLHRVGVYDTETMLIESHEPVLIEFVMSSDRKIGTIGGMLNE